MHAMHVCSRHLFGLPLRMYGMHRTRFDHESPPSTPHDLIMCVLSICHVKHGETYAKHSNGAKSLLDLQSLSPALSNFWLLLVITITKSVIFQAFLKLKTQEIPSFFLLAVKKKAIYVYAWWHINVE